MSVLFFLLQWSVVCCVDAFRLREAFADFQKKAKEDLSDRSKLGLLTDPKGPDEMRRGKRSGLKRNAQFKGFLEGCRFMYYATR